LPWNVHPPLDDQLTLIRQTAARQVIAAFVAPELAAEDQAKPGLLAELRRQATVGDRIRRDDYRVRCLPVAATLALARLLRVATPDCWRPDAVIVAADAVPAGC
jgi:hypothetical protein